MPGSPAGPGCSGTPVHLFPTRGSHVGLRGSAFQKAVEGQQGCQLLDVPGWLCLDRFRRLCLKGFDSGAAAQLPLGGSGRLWFGTALFRVSAGRMV